MRVLTTTAVNDGGGSSGAALKATQLFDMNRSDYIENVAPNSLQAAAAQVAYKDATRFAAIANKTQNSTMVTRSNNASTRVLNLASQVLGASVNDGAGTHAPCVGSPCKEAESCGQRGRYGYGTVEFNGDEYSIYVPELYASIDDGEWRTIDYDNLEVSLSVEFGQILCMAFEDINGESTHAGSYLAATGRATGGTAISLGSIQLISNIVHSLKSSYVTIYIQDNGQEQRAVLAAGSSSAKQIYDAVADDIPRYMGYASSPAGNLAAEHLYEDMTGIELSGYHKYDVKVSVDSQHYGTGDVAYLWYDEGKLMAMPIVYENDYAEVGVFKNIFEISFSDAAPLPLNTEPYEAPEYAYQIEGFKGR